MEVQPAEVMALHPLPTEGGGRSWVARSVSVEISMEDTPDKVKGRSPQASV